MQYRRTGAVCLCFLVFRMLAAQISDLSLAEINELYGDLRQMSLDSSRVLEAGWFSINKDVAEFEFKFGRIYFFEPIADRIVGGYFEGGGVFRLATDNDIEKHQIKRFIGGEVVEKEFERALFFFTDDTYEQMIARQQLTKVIIGDSVRENVELFRKKIRTRFVWNTDARILADLIDSQENRFFNAFLECLDGKELIYFIDPLDEEEVSLLRYERIKFSERADFETWYSSDALDPLVSSDVNFNIEHIDMDVDIGHKQELAVNAKVRFTTQCDCIRIIPIELVHVLRVHAAIIDAKDTCLVIQEGKESDAQLWLVFKEAPKRGRSYELEIEYSGEGIIEDLGGDNFAVVARTSWFPSFYTNPIDPRRFVMQFAVPAQMTLLATGELIRSWQKGDTAFSIWDSHVEHDFAGFNYGKFSMVSEQSEKCDIKCYTNVKLSDDLLEIRRLLDQYKELQSEFMLLPHELTTDRIGADAAIESRNAYEIYSYFFGEGAFREIKVSQQPQISFAQSWPTLIYLPFTAFWDESIKDRLGILRGEVSVMSYETIASHEIAHQWWGNTVMRDSYHDEWLMEGFATYASALYLQASKGIDRFKDYMKLQRQQVFAHAGRGQSYNDLGPIWLGQRLNSLDLPFGRRLIYAKGAYVLHMLRMMLFDYDNKNDERFIKMMKDYVRTYAGKIVTTNDFAGIVEKHFGADMDWFFKQWVYGTDIPIYKFTYDIEETNGNYYLTIAAQQRGVQHSFEMPVPFLVNFEHGYAVVRLNVRGDKAVAKKFRLPQKPVSIEVNPWNAVLCTIVQ